MEVYLAGVLVHRVEDITEAVGNQGQSLDHQRIERRSTGTSRRVRAIPNVVWGLSEEIASVLDEIYPGTPNHQRIH